MTATNCVFSGNAAERDAGGIYLGANSVAKISFSTFVSNRGPSHGGGAFFVTQSQVHIDNSILWGNGGTPIYPSGEPGISIAHSIVEGGRPGEGNSAANPLLDSSVRYHLRPDSPAIDAAQSSSPPSDDVEGSPRSCGDAPDIGAFEFGCAPPPAFRRGDANLDAVVDVSDAIFVLGFLFAAQTGIACEDAADVNDDGEIDVSDPIAELGFLFLGTPPALALPGDSCGPDETEDELDCLDTEACES